MKIYDVLYYPYYYTAHSNVFGKKRVLSGDPKKIGVVQAENFNSAQYRAWELAKSQNLKISHTRIIRTGEIKVKGHWTTRQGSRVYIKENTGEIK